MNHNLNQGPPPVGPIPQNPALDLRTIEELCQPTMNGRGGPIAPVNIQATNFRLKNHMIQQVQNICQFHGLPGDNANKHLDKFLTITQSMKQNGVTDDALCLYLFPYSLTHHAIAWFDRLPNNSNHNFEEMVSKFLSKYFPPSMVKKLRNDINTVYNGLTLRHRDTIDVAIGGTIKKRRPEECYDLIENMTAHHNDWDTSAQRDESSRSTTSSSPEIAALTQLIAKMNKKFLKMCQSNQQVNVVNPSCETCSGPHHYSECQAASGFTQGDVYAGVVLLKKLPEKLGDPGKFLILYDFSELEECMALADLGASINLMPLSVWKELMLLELLPTRMTLELANRSVSYPAGIAEDVFVQVDKRPFLRTARALVDVHGEELILRVGDEKLSFKVDSTLKYSHKHGVESINMIDIIDTTCDDHFSEVLTVQKSIHNLSGSTTPFFDPIVASLTPFGDINFLLEQTAAFLALDSIPPDIDNVIYDSEGDILFLETLLKDEPIVASSSLSLTPFGDIDFLLEETDAFLALDSIPPDIDNEIYDSEGDILFLESLLKDEPLKAEKSEINHVIREPSNTFLIGYEEIKFNPLKDIYDPVPIPRVFETPLDSLNSFLDTFGTTFTNPLFELDSEYTLNYDNLIFDT
ncbi:reverse transcriptase domain-containing protein [Tanacetum coccineum]